MNPWNAKIKVPSTPEHLAYWASLRMMGRNYYLRTCVLFFSSIAIGVGCLLDLMYHFVRFGFWQIGMLWLSITLFAVLLAVTVYSRRWALNEQNFKVYAQPGVQADRP